MSGDVEALAEEHVIDRDGMVWRIIRDGGMATRAHYAGVVSIGIATLEREHGPLVTLAAHDQAVRAEAWQEGYTAGHSNAMRRMSDEPNAPTSPNPYRAKSAADTTPDTP